MTDFSVPLPQGNWTLVVDGEDLGYTVTKEFASELASRVQWLYSAPVDVVERPKTDV